MNLFIKFFQVIVGLGLLNVWVVRFKKATPFRGGDSKDMLQEFKAYGLPPWSCYLVGTLKVSMAITLLLGLAFPRLVIPAAGVLAALMSVAISQHLQIKDPLKKSVPAALILAMCVLIACGQ